LKSHKPTFSTPRHKTHYIACGPADGPLMISRLEIGQPNRGNRREGIENI
jgi:hypothetical protein